MVLYKYRFNDFARIQLFVLRLLNTNNPAITAHDRPTRTTVLVVYFLDTVPPSDDFFRGADSQE